MRKISIIQLLLTYISAISAIEFEYYGKPLGTECFGEALNENTMMAGEVRSTHTYISVKLYDPNGRLLFFKSNETIIKFSLAAQVPGTFQICIDNLSRTFLNYVFKLETGVSAKDYSGMAKTHNLRPLEVILRKNEDILNEVQRTTSVFIQNKEQYIEELDIVGMKIMLFSIITIVIMIILGICQATYLKNFFKTKKLI